MRNTFEGAWNGMMSVVWLILSKYAYVVGNLLEWAVYLLRLLMHPLGPRDTDTGEVATDRKNDLFKDVDQSPYKDWSPYVKIAIFAAVLILLLVLVYRLTRRKPAPADDNEEEIVDLGFWPNLLNDLKGLFGSRRAGAAGSKAEAERLDARDPRMLFRRLQAWGAAIGRPREAYETPNAYRGAIGAVSPGDVSAAGAVTAVYNQARYSANPPNLADVAAAASAVEKLEKDEQANQ